MTATPGDDRVEYRTLGPNDLDLLESIAPGVFDGEVDLRRAEEFLADGRHHLVVARVAGQIVGIVSGVHYVHPDKAPELWVNEISVSPRYRGRGIGRQLLQRLLLRARELGAASSWLLVENDNVAARGLYESLGGRKVAPPPVMYEFDLTTR